MGSRRRPKRWASNDPLAESRLGLLLLRVVASQPRRAERATGWLTRTYPLDDAGSSAWIAHPHERMLRASSAVVTANGILVVDPGGTRRPCGFRSGGCWCVLKQWGPRPTTGHASGTRLASTRSCACDLPPARFRASSRPRSRWDTGRRSIPTPPWRSPWRCAGVDVTCRAPGCERLDGSSAAADHTLLRARLGTGADVSTRRRSGTQNA